MALDNGEHAQGKSGVVDGHPKEIVPVVLFSFIVLSLRPCGGCIEGTNKSQHEHFALAFAVFLTPSRADTRSV